MGHYCPPGTQYDTQYKCSSGSYNPLPTQSSSTACKLCDAGTYCLGDGLSAPTGNCSQGWFCTGGASESKPLVLGKFLPLWQGVSLIFTINKYMYYTFEILNWWLFSTGNYTSIDVCTCPANNYTGGKCQPGSFCPEGSSAPTSCTAGMYCDDYELATPKGL